MEPPHRAAAASAASARPAGAARGLGLRAALRSLPSEQATLIVVAAVVGVYAGLAAGLLSNFIHLFSLLLFQLPLVLDAVVGVRPAWRADFSRELAAAAWHPELAAFALCLLLTNAAARARRWKQRFAWIERAGTLGWAIVFGFALYYPLLVLTAWNRSFGEANGDLYGILQHCPRIFGVPVLWIAVPALGALLAGLVVSYVSPESGGHGVAEVLEATVAPGKRRIPGRVAFWKSMASGLVIGTGGSAGREGPVVQMGAAVASFLGRRLGLAREDASLLLVCGGGAGIAASFNAPFGGMAFALEILYGGIGSRALAPIVLSAVTASVTGRALIGGGEIQTVAYQMKSPADIAVYVLLGLFAGACAILYVKAVHGTERLFEGRAGGRLARVSRALARLRPETRAMVGGFGVGLLALLPFGSRALGSGYASMNAALAGKLGAVTLLVVLAVKLATTGLTLGSGSPGGSFFPAVFLGAMLGGLFGVVGHQLAPSLIAGSGPYAAIGMGAVVAGATLAPLTGVVMLFELTHSYNLIVPLMVACGLSVLVVYWRLGGSIYTLKLLRKGLTRMGERGDGLARVRVRDAMAPPPPAVGEQTPLDELVRRFAVPGTRVLAVRGADGRLRGLLERGDLVAALSAAPSSDPAGTLEWTARALCASDAPVLPPEATLEQAARVLAHTHREHALVAGGAGGEPIGLLSHQAIVAALARASHPRDDQA